MIPIIPVGTQPQRRPQKPPPTTPQQTLYVRNISEKPKLKEVEQQLKDLFSQYGSVVDIKVKRNIRHRGQAFVSFETVEQATKALQHTNGHFLFEKPIDVQYAREPSFAISDRLGTLKEHQEARVVVKRKLEELKATEKPKPKRLTPEDHLPPNSILFVQQLPVGTQEHQIVAMFRQFPGYKEVRLVPGNTEIAFVEYESVFSAGVAKQSLHGYRLVPNQELKVYYARK
ncbi:hypothetical protein EDD86DRAFT_187715 [Gorgonomyces haynaldii]|nr:hypothetical protein EDD86DRAFT_187715 [Gorgonomyces haynaldii]